MKPSEHHSPSLHIHHAAGTGHSWRDFLPLCALVTFVLIATGVSVALLGMHPMLAFMGWFFVLFGTLKVMRLSHFVEAYRTYDLLAARSRVYAYAYPFFELTAGAAYLFAWQVELTSRIVMAVMLVSALGVAVALRRKEEIPCACMGTVFAVPMTYVTLGEDLLMALMAMSLLI